MMRPFPAIRRKIFESKQIQDKENATDKWITNRIPNSVDPGIRIPRTLL